VIFVAKFFQEVGGNENVKEGDHPEDARVETREGPEELCPEYTSLYFEITIVAFNT
jgi:hypothetical protein